jgi:hypothetical protein
MVSEELTLEEDDGVSFFCFKCGTDVRFSKTDPQSCDCDFILSLHHMMMKPNRDDELEDSLVFADNHALIVDDGINVMLFQDEDQLYSLVRSDDTIS